MWLFWVLVIVALGWIVLRSLGSRSRLTGSDHGADEAEAILRARYARGEIDETSYRRMLEELRRER